MLNKRCFHYDGSQTSFLLWLTETVGSWQQSNLWLAHTCFLLKFNRMKLSPVRGGGSMRAIAPPPLLGTLFSLFCHRYEKVKQGPPQNKVDEIRGVFILGRRLAFISNFGLQPPNRWVRPKQCQMNLISSVEARFSCSCDENSGLIWGKCPIKANFECFESQVFLYTLSCYGCIMYI